MDLFKAFSGKTSRQTPEKRGPVKLDTYFQIKSFGTDFKRFEADFSTVVEQNPYSFRTKGVNILGELHQVTEIRLVAEEASSYDPEQKIIIENARQKHGVTSFGAGPHPERNRVMFQVYHTYVTFNWTNVEMPNPAVGTCLYVVGKERVFFPGPKFPMSHLLRGEGSEFDMSSVHKITDDVSLELNAEFFHQPWFLQMLHHRIVLPGMSIPEFLSLSLHLVGDTKTDDRFMEPFHISQVCIELQEFVSVRKYVCSFEDVRTMVVSNTSPNELASLAHQEVVVPPECYDCKLPEIGPTFFTNGFTRSYGLKITMKLVHKSIPGILASTFLELNVAEKKEERINFEECPGLEVSDIYYDIAPPLSQEALEKHMANNQDQLRSFSDDFDQYLLLSHRNGSAGCLLFFIESSRSTCSNLDSTDSNGFIGYFKKSLRLYYAKLACKAYFGGIYQCGRGEKQSNPVPGGDVSNSKKPYAMGCLMVGNDVVEAIPPEQFHRRVRALDIIALLGDEKVPLASRIVMPDDKVSKSFGFDAIAKPGMKLSDIISFTYILPQSFQAASRENQVEDYSMNFTYVEVCLFSIERSGFTILKSKKVLLEKTKLPSIRWSEFKESVPGSLSACAFILPEETFDAVIPLDLQPSKVSFRYSRQFFIEVWVYLTVNGKEHGRLRKFNLFIAK